MSTNYDPKIPAAWQSWSLSDGYKVWPTEREAAIHCDAGFEPVALVPQRPIQKLREALIRCQSTLYIIYCDRGMSPEEARSMYEIALAEQALSAAPPQPAPQPLPKVTEFNVGRWCLSEDECIAQGISFEAYERGVADAAAAFARNGTKEQP